MLVPLFAALTWAHVDDDNPKHIYVLDDTTANDEAGWAAFVFFCLLAWCAIYACWYSRIWYEDCNEPSPQASTRVFYTVAAPASTGAPPVATPVSTADYVSQRLTPAFNVTLDNAVEWIDRQGDVVMLRVCAGNMQLHAKMASRQQTFYSLQEPAVARLLLDFHTGMLTIQGHAGKTVHSSPLAVAAPQFHDFVAKMHQLAQSTNVSFAQEPPLAVASKSHNTQQLHF